MKRDQIVIFFLIAVMIFSAIAGGLILLAQNNDTPPETTAANNDNLNEEELVSGCQSSEDALATPGTPVGDWPTTIDKTLTELQVTDLREGTGAELKLDDCISVHYRLSLADGTPVDGNDTFEELGQPIAFKLSEGDLIPGWTAGLPGMKEGGFRRLLVPASMAYGETARPGIPANSDLIFDVELVKIES